MSVPKINPNLIINECSLSRIDNAIKPIQDTSGSNVKEMLRNKLQYCKDTIPETHIETFVNGGWSGVNFGFGFYSRYGTTYHLLWYSTFGIFMIRQIGNNYEYYQKGWDSLN